MIVVHFHCIYAQHSLLNSENLWNLCFFLEVIPLCGAKYSLWKNEILHIEENLFVQK